MVIYVHLGTVNDLSPNVLEKKACQLRNNNMIINSK